MSFNIDVKNNDMVVLSNKLQQTHKSALPVAVRQTLDDAAFETRQKHLGKSFEDQFTVRKKNFLRSHSHVNKSPNTFDLNKMESEVGILKGKSESGDNLKKQELGGRVEKRDYIPLPGARASKSAQKTVSKRFYLTRIKVREDKPVFKQQEFIRAAFAAGEKGYLIVNNVLVQIRKIKKPSRDKLFISVDPLYHYEKGRSADLRKRPFLQPAGEKAYKDIPKIFTKRAEQRFKKYM